MHRFGRFLDDAIIPVAMTGIIVCLVLVFIAVATGCETVQSQQPTDPGHANASVEKTGDYFDPKTGEYVPPKTSAELDLTNDQNAADAMEAEVRPDGITLNTGGSTPLEMGEVISSPLFMFGAGCVIVGLVLVGFGNHPFVAALTQGAAKEIGWLVAGGGVLLILMPYIGEGVKDAVPGLLILGALVAVVLIARNRKKIAAKFDELAGRVSPEVEADLLAEGDTRAAGAVRRIRTGSKAESKMVAGSPGNGVTSGIVVGGAGGGGGTMPPRVQT